MRRNVYLGASGNNSDISIRCLDSDFHIGSKISAISRRFLLCFFHRKSNKSAIFRLPVYFTHWLRNRATWLATHDDNFYQVWSWHDYPSPSYNVAAANTLRDHDLDLLTLSSRYTWRVRWSIPTIPPTSLKILYAYPLLICELRCLPCATVENTFAATAHAPYHVTRTQTNAREDFPHILEIRDPDLSTHFVTFIPPWSRWIQLSAKREFSFVWLHGHRADCACTKSRSLLKVPHRVAKIVLSDFDFSLYNGRHILTV